MMRLNKSFIVHRSLSGRREKLAAYQLLSAYINHSIRNDCVSIWIAQAEGRAKDGDDRTDSAILKMFHMSRKDEAFGAVIQSLNLTPVSISYEYDPCDLAKARELYIRATTGTYKKAPGEDDNSIAQGITGYKGRVHISFAAPVTEYFEDTKQLAQEIDRQILGGYRLFPVHYLAYGMWSEADPALQVPSAEKLFPAQELAKARKNGSAAWTLARWNTSPTGAAVRHPGAQPVPCQGSKPRRLKYPLLGRVTRPNRGIRCSDPVLNRDSSSAMARQENPRM